jgi:hypothetical protein
MEPGPIPTLGELSPDLWPASPGSYLAVAQRGCSASLSILPAIAVWFFNLGRVKRGTDIRCCNTRLYDIRLSDIQLRDVRPSDIRLRVGQLLRKAIVQINFDPQLLRRVSQLLKKFGVGKLGNIIRFLLFATVDIEQLAEFGIRMGL